MFVKSDFLALQHAAQLALGRGEDPALQTFERIRDEAMKRKILQADIVKHTTAHTIGRNDIIHIAIGDGLMEGFYIVDITRNRAWRWEDEEDEGEAPCYMTEPRRTPAGLPQICGTCRHSRGPRFHEVQCTIHPDDHELNIYFTCRSWALRDDM